VARERQRATSSDRLAHEAEPYQKFRPIRIYLPDEYSVRERWIARRATGGARVEIDFEALAWRRSDFCRGLRHPINDSSWAGDELESMDVTPHRSGVAATRATLSSTARTIAFSPPETRAAAAYSDWLEALTKYFFGAPYADRRVRLLVTRQILDVHFGSLGGTVSFLAALRGGPDWAFDHPDRSMCEFGLGLFRQWSAHGKVPARAQILGVPTYLPYLCLLCFAWTEGNEDDFSEAEFYNRLTRLFPEHRLRSRLGEWGQLWEGLERWTKRDGGRNGIFKIERLGAMAHVGIPKAQVLFTPTKVERMPRLFHDLGLSPTRRTGADQLMQLLRQNENLCVQCLGGPLAREIARSSDLGRSAVEILREYLAEWDGGMTMKRSSRPTASPGGAGVEAPTRVSIVVERTEDDGWAIRLGVEDDGDCEAIDFGSLGWRFRRVEPGLHIMVSKGGEPVNGADLVADGTAMTLPGRWLDGEKFGTPRYEVRPRKAWFFDTWTANRRLIECRRVTSAVGVYILLPPGAANEWREWLRPRSASVTVEDYSAHGLPHGFKLLFVRGLDRLTAAQLNGLPGLDGSSKSSRRFATLTGGTLVRDGTARPVYAEYDPPFLALQGPRSLELHVDGAKETLLDDLGPDDALPGEVRRLYSFAIEQGNAIVLYRVTNGGEMVQESAFAIEDENLRIGNVVATTGRRRVDEYGDLAGEAGVFGASSPAAGPSWKFQEGHLDLGGELPDRILESGWVNLADSTSVLGRRFGIQEYRERALRLTDAPRWRLYTELRWLQALGHVEIEVDDRGRWSHVHPVRRQLYLLPWLHRGRHLAALAGCGSRTQLADLLKTAQALGCEIRYTESRFPSVPGRVLFVHREKEVLRNVAAAHATEWIGYCAASAIANWSCDLERWLQCPSLRWHPHKAPPDLPQYEPELYRIESASRRYAAPWKLFSMIDPYSGVHRWHVLQREAAPMDPGTGVRHAFLRDPAWARWKAHHAVADGDETVVPYIESERAIPIPYALHLPFLLSRALVLCSGLAPREESFSPAYADARHGVLTDGAPRYGGACWHFAEVPLAIAETVAKKLSGTIKRL
jgi:hypothetical protein